MSVSAPESCAAESRAPQSCGLQPRAPQSCGLQPRAVVLGCAGPVLDPVEVDFFRAADPLGFILFRRNIASPDQLRALIAALRSAVGRDDAPILIDQEGGRVARLRPPHWPDHPAARSIGELAVHSPAEGREAAWLNGRLLAATLYDLGITVDCAPVCDVPVPHAHDVIGDRAFAENPILVAELARAFCDGLLAGGVLPVIKHIPGHGRARADSHLELPVVDAPRHELLATDFLPFRQLADMPLGMLAHVVYREIDPARPATTSPDVISGVVRKLLGFDGLLLSDDLSMGALEGTPAVRARDVLAAGCDIVLHCNGRLDEMAEVVAVTPRLEGVVAARWQRARAALHPPEPLGIGTTFERLQTLLAGGGTAQTAAAVVDPTAYTTLTPAPAVG
ncbi:MAG: beta-N-acetylhexosaminidase [Rhodospirillaceae bacterium]